MPIMYNICGFRVAQVRKVCSFFFGDFYRDTEIDRVNRIFLIRVNKTLKIKQGDKIKEEKIEDYVDIESFKKHFGGTWKIIYDNYEEA